MATKFINFEHEASQVDTAYFDDIFLSGFKVRFDSKVYGDLFSFSYEMVQSDTIDGNFMAFAQTVQNLGPVTGSYRAFGRRISCNSDVGRNLLLAGQEINVGPGGRILRDADMAGANVVFQGAVEGTLKISAQMAVVSGTIGGDLIFKGDSLTISPNTVINGNVSYDSPSRATIGEAATIHGQVNWKKTEREKPADDAGGGFWAALIWIASIKGYLVWSIVSSLLILVFILIPFPTWLAALTFWFILAAAGNLTLLLTRSKAYATESVLRNRLFPSMGLGFIIFFMAPVIALVLFFTILLSPLALIITMLFGIAVFIGGIYASLYLGRSICVLLNPGARHSPGYLCFTIGMTILLLLSLIPILGYIIMFVVLMTSVGALVQALWRPRTEPIPAKAPVGFSSQ
jgi:hypothetical protein